MSTDNSGNYTLPSADIVNGQVGDATPVQDNFDDIEAGLTERLTKTGKTTPTANLPMGGFKHTSIGAGSANGDSVRFEQLGQTASTITGAVATGTTLIPADDTIPQNTEGDQYMTLAITPKSATSKLIIDVVVMCAASGTAPQALTAALFQDSTAGALAVGWALESDAGQPTSIVFRHVMTSGTTSATTFKVRAGAQNAGTFTFNGVGGSRFYGGVLASSIVIREVNS